MKMNKLKAAAKEYGIHNLSKKTGISRSHLYKIFEGKSSPTLDTLSVIAKELGFSIILERNIPEDSVLDASIRTAKDGKWTIHFFNFVDAFRRTKDLKLIEKPPCEDLGEKERALLASIVLHLCFDNEIKDLPQWVQDQKPLEHPWFVSGIENLKAMALVESPPFYKMHNIFVLENFLSRA